MKLGFIPGPVSADLSDTRQQRLEERMIYPDGRCLTMNAHSVAAVESQLADK